MAKAKRGGQRARYSTVKAPHGYQASASGSAPAPPDDTQQTAQVNTSSAPAFSAGYQAFMALNDDQKADVVNKAVSQGVPSHLSQSDFQKFLYNSGLNDKPDVVDNATFNKTSGTTLYRTINSVYDRRNDISYTADLIGKQIIAGSVTRTSDNGGSMYGRGLYFASNRSSSTIYGNTRGNIKKTAMVQAKLGANAKVMSYNSASRGVSQEIRSGSKLGRALNRLDRASAESVYAMCKGYNVLFNGNDYYCVLDRSALVMSNSIEAI